MRTLQELDHLREQAILLRRQGKSLRQIKEILGPMSNATLKIEGWAASSMAALRAAKPEPAGKPSLGEASADTATGWRPVSCNHARGNVP